MRHNNLQDLQVLSRLRPLSVESLDLEYNRLTSIDLGALSAFSSRLQQLRLAHNRLTDLLEVAAVVEHLPKLRQITLAQNVSSWHCTDSRRTLDALRRAQVEVLDLAEWPRCFEPRHAIEQLGATFALQYNRLLLLFVVTTSLLIATIASMGLVMRRSLRRLRADSISKSFDIKMSSGPENIYEENVYNHVYAEPTPTTTL